MQFKMLSAVGENIGCVWGIFVHVKHTKWYSNYLD